MNDKLSKFEEFIYTGNKFGEPVRISFNHYHGNFRTHDGKLLERNNTFIIDDKENSFDIYSLPGGGYLECYIDTGLIEPNGLRLFLKTPRIEIYSCSHISFAAHPSRLLEKDYFEELARKRFGSIIKNHLVEFQRNEINIPKLGYFKKDYSFLDVEGNVAHSMLKDTKDYMKVILELDPSNTELDESVFLYTSNGTLKRILQDTDAVSFFSKPPRKTSNK